MLLSPPPPKKEKLLRRSVYQTLKSGILRGDIPPGKRLIENQIANELGTSRTPVREALQKLEHEKLISPVESRGFKVNEFTNDKIDEIFGIRAILEGYAGRLAVNHIPDRQLKQLEKNIKETEYFYHQWDANRLFNLNTKFHDVIIQYSRSEMLSQLLASFREYIQRYRLTMLYQKERFHSSIEHHKNILQALKGRDGVAVEKALQEHILEAKEVLLTETKRLFR
jgi:DNA-binding GntR family transcriptional regulator